MRTLALLATLTLMPAPRTQTTLAELRDHARPLLIFARSPDDPQLQIQLGRLQQATPAMAERDILAIAIPYESPSPTRATLTPKAANEARRQFHIAPTDFVVILIGKDGGEKLRSTEPLSIDKLRETIDAMPMRQHEIRHPH